MLFPISNIFVFHQLSERLQFCLPEFIAMGEKLKFLHNFQMADTIEVIDDVIFVRILY
jgi:hypothetical protein